MVRLPDRLICEEPRGEGDRLEPDSGASTVRCGCSGTDVGPRLSGVTAAAWSGFKKLVCEIFLRIFRFSDGKVSLSFDWRRVRDNVDA